LRSLLMTCGWEQKTNQTGRYLVLLEIYLGIGLDDAYGG
jgi:hypothetical protein